MIKPASVGRQPSVIEQADEKGHFGHAEGRGFSRLQPRRTDALKQVIGNVGVRSVAGLKPRPSVARSDTFSSAC